MSQMLLANFAGLVTDPGQLARNSASCIYADNVLFDAAGVMRKRRGFARGVATGFGTATGFWKLCTSQILAGQFLAHVGNSTGGLFVASGNETTGFGALFTSDGSGIVNATVQNRAQFAVAQRNHYMTSVEGVRRIESDLSMVRWAGMPRGVIRLTSPAGVSNPQIPDGWGRAYRVTWHRKDADGVELGGAPTGRIVYRNISGVSGWAAGVATGAVIVFDIPSEVGTVGVMGPPGPSNLTTSYYWRLWASRTADLSIADPDDEMYLIAERYLSAAEIAAGQVSGVIDGTPNAYLLTAPTLHTNTISVPPGEAGILQGVANEDASPPIANDIAYFADCMWFGDVSSQYRAQLTMLALPADGDTLVFTTAGRVTQTVTVTAKTTPTILTHYGIITSFTAASVNIERTALNLVVVINTQVAGVRAFYVPTSGVLPGSVFIEAERGVTLSIATTAANWRGVSNGHPAGSQDVNTNGLYFSKPFRADAVPPVNFIAVGPRDNVILKLVPYRDRLFIFTKYGIWQLQGHTYADFSLSPFDLTFRLRSRELVTVCEDAIFAWGLEGIASITYGGVTFIHQQITNLVEAVANNDPAPRFQLVPTTLTGLAEGAFAVGYGRKHEVRFFIPSGATGSSNRGCSQWLSYDARTKMWSTGSTAADWKVLCGVARVSDDRQVLGQLSAANSFVYVERAAYNATDYADDDSSAVAQAIIASISFQYQMPDPIGGSHFQQIVLHFDNNDASGWQKAPSTVAATFNAAGGGASYPNAQLQETIANIDRFSRSVRFEVPMQVRRAQSVRFDVFHSVGKTGLAEYFGLVGLGVMVSDNGTKFSHRAAT